MSRRPLLDLSGVEKVYRSGDSELRALDGIDLTIAAGEYVAIIGQSGSGKSTLMNILGCLDRPSAGRYRVAGHDIAAMDADAVAALRRDTFGFVFQRYNLLADASAIENVEVPAIYAGLPRDDREDRALALLERLGIGDRGGHRPGQLSGGQQQRVSIARALMNDAAVILADEPTGALDSRSGQDVLALLEALHGEGRTIILITHDAEVAARADRIIHIHDGRIVADDTRRAALPELEAPVPPARSRGGSLGGLASVAEAAKMALRSLRTNPFRTALTLLGVVIGVAAVVAMLAIGDGSKRDVMDRMASLGTNLMVIRPGAPGVRPSGDNASLTFADAEALRAVPNVTDVVPERSLSATIRFGGVDYRTSVQATWPGFATARDWPMADGLFFGQEDLAAYAPVVVLGQTVAGTLFPDGGSPVGEYVLIGTVPFEVVGVLAAKGASAFGRDEDDIALVPLSTGRTRLFGGDYVNGITVRVADTALNPQTQAALTELLVARHGSEDFRVRDTASLLETAERTQDTLTILLGSVALISLLVGGIGVMNIMLVSVTERTREIGVRMATGARMRDILLQFNTEAIVVCGIGGLLGIAFGLAAAWTASVFGVSVVYSPWPPLLAFSCAFATGLVFGYLPARKAARLDPVVALASE